MRSARRFMPACDCLQDRIAPSAIVAVAPHMSEARGVAISVAMDETGGPSSDPSGTGSGLPLMTPPGNTPPPSSTLC